MSDQESIVSTPAVHLHIHTPMAVAPAGETIDERILRVRQQPEGYYWLDEETGRRWGPFESLDEAIADMDGPGEEAIERSETDEQTEPPDDRVDR